MSSDAYLNVLYYSETQLIQRCVRLCVRPEQLNELSWSTRRVGFLRIDFTNSSVIEIARNNRLATLQNNIVLMYVTSWVLGTWICRTIMKYETRRFERRFSYTLNDFSFFSPLLMIWCLRWFFFVWTAVIVKNRRSPLIIFDVTNFRTLDVTIGVSTTKEMQVLAI